MNPCSPMSFVRFGSGILSNCRPLLPIILSGVVNCVVIVICSFFVSFLLGLVTGVVQGIIDCFWKFDQDPC